MRYLLKIKKHGKFIYTSHHDTNRAIEYTLRRLNCPMKFSKGYHPIPSFSFSPPIPLGYMVKELYIAVDTIKNFDFSNFNKKSPKGLTLMDAKIVDDKYTPVNEIKGYYITAYLSKNMYEKLLKINPEFSNLKAFKNKKNIFVIEYYRDIKNFHNILKDLKYEEYQREFVYLICKKTLLKNN
ncbi:hypothetical protein OSSY52_10190 [Tepiditoga spiralis]|uniref:DUF2344 domain-containing protein n=1 Tax=Tepiditoga spiralis TaxID=2108365 RepID=A0A7G1G390_9BACT|nr:TIGR03936 family radical SAM-associated protein [Tepiditoga spiralis]BBE30878.1 hypothetical protein OSSY52_10190 [Tepiditoga spiralis]